MAKSTNIEFNMLNPDTISRLIDDGEIKVPDKKVDIPKDERWNEKQMASKILQGLLNGDDILKMSESMQDVVGNNVNSAIRNTRTMVTSAENQGRLDSYEKLSEQGLVLKKKWIATPDERTRASHLAIDGELQDLDKPFSNKCRFPGDGQGPAQEVWMCRCTMGTKVIGYRRADGSISYVGGGRTTSIHSMQMADERARRARTSAGTPTVVQSYSDRIRAIADDVAQNGLTSEKVMEAGRILANEVNADLENRKLLIKEAELNLQNAGGAELDVINNDLKYKEARKIDFDQHWHVNNALTQDNSEYWKGASLEDIRAYISEKTQEIEKIKNTPEYQQALEALRTIRNQCSDGVTNSQMLFDYLSEIREMGAEGIDLKGHLQNSRSPMRRVVEQAYGFYPRSWVEASVANGSMKPSTSDRGYYWHNHHGVSEIAISGYSADGKLETAFHELGHRFEATVGNIRGQEKLFYEMRTAGEELQWLGEGYARSERTRLDNFIDSYMGKAEYSDGSFELVSMGFQYAYIEPNVLAKDPEMQAWILGLLSLVP